MSQIIRWYMKTFSWKTCLALRKNATKVQVSFEANKTVGALKGPGWFKKPPAPDVEAAALFAAQPTQQQTHPEGRNERPTVRIAPNVTKNFTSEISSVI